MFYLDQCLYLMENTAFSKIAKFIYFLFPILMQVQKMKMQLNCCLFWGFLAAIGLTICIVIFQKNVILLVVLLIMLGMLLIIGPCICCYQSRQIRRIRLENMAMGAREVRIRQPENNQPRGGGGGGGIGRKENERRKPLLQSFSLYDQQNTCCICLEGFDQQQKAAMLPCGHLYHSKCIKDWIAVSQQCPICRKAKDES